MSSKDVLITGGLGYIGGHTVHQLIMDGYNPIIVDNVSNSTLQKYHALCSFMDEIIPFYKGDFSDINLLEKIFKENPNIKYVIHLAANKSVIDSETNKKQYIKNNIKKSLQFFNYLNDKRIKKLIFASSAAVYKPKEKLTLYKETDDCKPISTYGKTKLVVENILQHTNYSFDYTILRYFNVFGVDIYDKYTMNENIFHEIFNSIENKKPFKIYGINFKTCDGTAIRDYISVFDVAKINLLSLKNIKNDIINVGTGYGTSVKEITNQIKLLKFDLMVENKEPRKNEITYSIADNTKLINYGFYPYHMFYSFYNFISLFSKFYSIGDNNRND